MLKGKTVLITGATGFVGGRLVEKLVLEQQARVRTLVRNFGRASRLARFPIEFIAGDITDAAAVRQAMHGCEIVFHCAHESALPGQRQKLAATQGTQNICATALELGVEQMIHVSSLAVYGPTPPGDLTEASPWQPTDHSYMVAKRLTERMVLDLHQEAGLPVVVLQPTAVYGPYCRPWTLQPVEDLKTGLVPLVDGGQGYCNAVYIDDAVEAMLLAATNPAVRGETFLISGEEPVTWNLWGLRSDPWFAGYG
jgi:nucleoside-diphosphate-sugar epimerase